MTKHPQQGTLRLCVSKGTYVRTLVCDMGASLGTLAVMHSLVRTRAGAYPLDACHTFDEVERAMQDGTVQDLLLPVDGLFAEHPAVPLNRRGRGTHRARRSGFFRGRRQDCPKPRARCAASIMADRFLMLGQVRALDKGGLGLFVYKNFR